MKCKCLCVAVRLVYHCVCIYRCIHLKELAVYDCYNVTDAGIFMVISHCSQLRGLSLMGLEDITGMCALCEDRESTLCFITMVYDVLTARASLTTNAHHWTILWAGTFITFSLILHCIACCSQIHPIIIIIPIFNDMPVTVVFPFSQYSIFFYWASSIPFPMQNLIQNSCIVIHCYHFQHLPTFFVAEIVSVCSSLVLL